MTSRGRILRQDPIALWWHIAERTPPRSTDPSHLQAGLILLVATAAQAAGNLNATIADLLGAIGWMHGLDLSPPTDLDASQAAWTTAAVLRRLGALSQTSGQHPTASPSPEQP